MLISVCQLFQADKFKRPLMRALQYNRRRNTCLVGFFPSQCTQTPTISSDQARKSVLWSGCDEIITSFQRKLQKCLSHLGANDMAAMVVCIQFATAVSEIACEWIVRARNELCAQYIQLSCHGLFMSDQYSSQYKNSLSHCVELGRYG
jgi:hypothetical protein